MNKNYIRGGAGKGKMARHIEAQIIVNIQMRRCSSDRGKVNVITRGDLELGSVFL